MSVREVVQYQITMTAQGAQATAAAVKSVDASAKQVTAGVKSAEEAVKKSMALMGGSFGKLGEVAFELTGKVSGAAGAIGAAGAAAALSVVAVAALSYAGVQLAAAAFEAGERLEKAGLQAMIPAEAQESLDRYKDGTTALRNSADLLTVTLGGPLLDAVGNLSLGLSGLISKLSDVKTGFDDTKPAAGSFQQVASDLFGVVHSIVNAGTFGILEGIETAVDGLVTEGEAVAEVQTAVAAKSEEVKKAADEEAKAVKKSADDQERLAKELNAAILADTKAMYATEERMRIANYTAQKAFDDQRLAEKEAAEKATAARVAAMQPTADAAAAIDTSGLAGALGSGGSGILKGAANGLLGVATGGASGAMGALGAAGPVGAAIAAVVALPYIIDQIAGTVDGLVDMFETFPDRLREALTETLPGILDKIPDLVTAIVEAVIALPGILMEMVPELTSSLTALVPTLIGDLVTSLAENLPTMLADGLSSLLSGGLYGAILKGVWDGMNEALNGLPDKIAEAIGKLLSPLTKPFKDSEGDFLGTDLKAAKGEKKLFGINVPFFDTGTPRIQRGGLAVVHEGERISSVGEGRSGGSPINVTVVADSPRDMIRQMQGLLGPYGLGETLTGLGP